jgi:hypothetical protein
MKNKIRVIIMGLLLGGMMVWMNGCSGMVEKFSGTQHIHRVLETGKPAEATVLKIWETGITVNEYPVVGFLLEVKPIEGDVYQATTQCIISILDIPQIQPGKVLPAKYDAADPSKVALNICR